MTFLCTWRTHNNTSSGTINDYKDTICDASKLYMKIVSEDNVRTIVSLEASQPASLNWRYILDAVRTTLNNILAELTHVLWQTHPVSPML